MSAFSYQALKQNNGNTVNGVIEADSLRHARQLLREKGLVPLQVKGTAKHTNSINNDKLATSDLTLLTRQLATLIGAGIPIVDALQSVSEQTIKVKVKTLIMGVRSRILEGYSFARALQEFPKSFPSLFSSTVAAGEQTGHLDAVLLKLADYTEKQQGIKQKVQQALIYPLLMVTMSTLIIGFLLAFVVPKIIAVFTDSGQTLPLMTQILISFSSFCQSYGLIVILFIIISIVVFRRCLKYRSFQQWWHNLLLKIFILSYLVKSVNVARYIHTFGILFAAGVNVLESMKVSSTLLNNVVMREAFDIAAKRVKEGTPISQALREPNYLNPMALYLIASGEKSGQIATMMEHAATHLEQEVKRLIDTALSLLEPLIILAMGSMVLFIVLATLLPIFSMDQLVN